MQIKNEIDDFLLSKEIESGCSPATIRAYQHDLKLFDQSLRINTSIEQINQIHVRAFLKILRDREYTKTAIARKIACLKSFFNFLEDSEMILKNPMKKINSPKIKREEQLPKFLALGEMISLLGFLKQGTGIPYTIRKRGYIIIRLLYSTMARVSEIANARVGDIDFTAGILKLRGKGNKQRIVPIDQETLNTLNEYLRERISYSDSDPLLVNKYGNPLSVRTIQKDIQIIKEKFGLAKDKKLLMCSGTPVQRISGKMGWILANFKIYSDTQVQTQPEFMQKMIFLKLKKNIPLNIR
jgi:site-specific recombinase XerD